MFDLLPKNKKKRIEPLIVRGDASIVDTLKMMDDLGRKLLIVADSGDELLMVSIGDIQRAIISNIPYDSPISAIARAVSNLRTASPEDSFESVKKLMMKFRTELMPIIDAEGQLVDIFFWEDVYRTEVPDFEKIRLPVVIMAGGKGTRLKPFSNVLPKPLFPLGEKTILETIIERFNAAGCKDFFVSVNYKQHLIRAYFEELGDLPYNLNFFTEPKPLGTAGSLKLVREEIEGPTFIVSNCDILVDTDFSELLQFHQKQANEITLVSSLKSFNIQYGTLETEDQGQLKSIQEKPSLTYQINAGLYVLQKELLDNIPNDTKYDITTLIESILARKGRVGVFPVSEGSWYDIGQWEEYRRTIDQLGLGSGGLI